MTRPVQPNLTTAFYVRSIVSFSVSIGSTALAIVYLPADPWVRAFLCVAVLYTVTSSFTLAKCIRDRQEMDQVTTRVDQARLDKLLVEHDPFKAKAS